MEKQLHILKNGSDLNAQSIIEILAWKHPEEIKVVLIQDGLRVKPTWKVKTFFLKEEAPFPIPFPEGIEAIDYSRFVDLIFEADSVVAW